MPLISMVVAATENDVIGRDNGMPWHLPDDLKYFKARTMGKPMLMGRKTFESIGKPLPGRTSVVLTRDPKWHADGVVVVRSIDEALCWADGMPELCAVGGAEIFRLDDADGASAVPHAHPREHSGRHVLPEARSARVARSRAHRAPRRRAARVRDELPDAGSNR